MMSIWLSITSSAFTYRTMHPTLLFPYYRAALESDTARSLHNPAFLTQFCTFFIDMNYEKPYNLKEISAMSARAGFSLPFCGAMLTWNSFGIDEYKEETVEASFGYKIGKYATILFAPNISKLVIRTDLVDFNEYFVNYRGGISFFPFPLIEISYHQENIRSFFLKEGSDIHYPSWSVGIALRPTEGFSMSWNLNKTYFSYINTFAVSANLLKWLAVSGGYSRETSSIAGAATLFVDGIVVSYCIRYHSYLGTTHSFSATIRYGGMPLEEISYSKPIKPSCNEPINVKTCTSEDLQRIGIAPPVAERIVKYRETVGPVTKKSLIQMGLTPKEYKRISHCLFNLTNDETSKPKNTEKWNEQKWKKVRISYKQNFPFRNAETRRLLFQKLVHEGVKASSALRISELAKDLTRKKLIETIEHLSFLSESEKIAARRACAEQ
ncbi:MAG: helix-hairpin-helix domain-containing protein [Spirochaetes bacterium]|nr:helix-hairpin-helix domain-containing protein [Spirochaetota bacterium]